MGVHSLGRSKKVAVVLCGSGYRDGSEIRESVAVLWALSVEGAQVQCFAPDAPQADVVNCLTGSVMTGETRNQLIEAARIARGQVLPLSKLVVGDFDALVLPGGFGAAKNLSTFAREGAQGQVIPELLAALQGFAAASKPIGAVCIAPAIVALAFRGKGLELTLGATSETSAEIEKLGHHHRVCGTRECVVDRSHRIVSTPAYMDDSAALQDLFTGIHACVRETLALC